MQPTYENLRYEVLRFWHFCVEFGPTTWRQAFAEYLYPGESIAPIAVWFNALPRSERTAMRKRLAADFASGVKYRAPRGHAAVVKGA